MSRTSRRSFFRNGSILGLGALSAGASSRALADGCDLVTPEQTEGPFYPRRRRTDENFDLTTVDGAAGVAAGEAIVVHGVVRDTACAPIAGAVVEIWQADDHGRYDHPGDRSPTPLDPAFQYWGRVTTGADGRYSFKTIRPGLYTGRTRHIHFRVVAPRHPTLTTQLYFEGEAANARDGIYRSMSAAERASVTSALVADPVTAIPTGRFDVVMPT